MKTCECGCGLIPKRKESRWVAGHQIRSRPRNIGSLEERFFKRIKKTSTCWLWDGYRIKHGYGKFSISRRFYVLAHRFSWQFHNKIEIPNGYFICHKCDNPPCVNPEHLYAGTQIDNMRDAAERKRMPKGEFHHKAKINEDSVIEIFKLRKNGMKHSEIALKFKMSTPAICNILNRKDWGHIEIPKEFSYVRGKKIKRANLRHRETP